MTAGGEEVIFHAKFPCNFSSQTLYGIGIDADSGELLAAEPVKRKLSWWKRIFSPSPPPRKSTIVLSAAEIKKFKSQKTSDSSSVGSFFLFLGLTITLFSLGY